jgi:glycosyltransferase involved in cell wall biosynthesis
MKIAINAQIDPETGVGGVESVIIGLVKALGQLCDGNEQYVIVTNDRHPDWLHPYLGPNQTVAVKPGPGRSAGTKKTVLRAVRKEMQRVVHRVARRLSPPTKAYPTPKISNGFFESLGCDVIHFPYQHFEICALPSIYNPHDLQHRHFPQFFTPETWLKREVEYRAGCEYSHTVVAACQWVKEDLLREYSLHPDRVSVIPLAPPTQAYATPCSQDGVTTREKYALPESFVFYPAMPWEHKNHLRLLEAIARLRNEKGLRLNLIGTSKSGRFFPQIERKIDELDLRGQVRFLGFVSPQELRCLYQASKFVIIPTLFEATSEPIYEAWNEDAPVACSTVTSLPEQVKNAALLFNPYRVDDIAAALETMDSDDTLRAQLKWRGKQRLKDFSWDRSARAYRALYRRAGHQEMTDEDRMLLSWDWLRHDTPTPEKVRSAGLD